GAGILVLEEREHALKRGARIYGELLGFGSGCDANPGGGLDPNGRGTAIALTAALRDAGLTPDAVGHVNAHGLGTVASDLAESRGIHSVFGDSRTPVTALKGYLGSLVSGCGAVELIGSLLAVNHGRVPPILNCDQPDPACAPLSLVRERPLAIENPIFAKCNVTRHGQAAALIVQGNPGAN
ncbi:MAG: beta-ketoacyl-[acyl-carrier-protein] synthase family protein, partial [Isosphaeraceae bacterium]